MAWDPKRLCVLGLSRFAVCVCVCAALDKHDHRASDS